MELAPASAWQKQPERETVVWQHNSLAEALMNSRPGNKTASHSEDLAPHEAKKDKKVCDYPIGYWHSDLHSAISTTEKQIPKWNLLQISAA